MNETDRTVNPHYVSTVYFAEASVNSTPEKAWKILLDYEAWNPTFADAQVVPVSGKLRSEGELVLIKKSLMDVGGEPLPDFYAETVKVVPQRRIVWCVYPQDESFRNFVDFGIAETASGVTFDIRYYEQNHLSGELLAKQRKDNEAAFHTLARAFKDYCETHE